MVEQAAVPARRLSAEFVAIVAVGVSVLLAVFAQAAWLDGKFERIDASFERLDARFTAKFERLDAKFTARFEQLDARFTARFEQLDARFTVKIEALQVGQASLDKRLAVVESHVLGRSLAAPMEGGVEPAC